MASFTNNENNISNDSTSDVCKLTSSEAQLSRTQCFLNNEQSNFSSIKQQFQDFSGILFLDEYGETHNPFGNVTPKERSDLQFRPQYFEDGTRITQLCLDSITTVFWNHGVPFVSVRSHTGKLVNRAVLLPDVKKLVLQVKQLKTNGKDKISSPFCFKEHRPYKVQEFYPENLYFILQAPNDKKPDSYKTWDYSQDFRRALVRDAQVVFKTDLDDPPYFVKRLAEMCCEKQFDILRQYKPIQVRFIDPLAKFHYNSVEMELPAPNVNRSLEWVKDMTHNDKYQSNPTHGIRLLKEFQWERNDLQKVIDFCKRYNFKTTQDLVSAFCSLNSILWNYQYFKNKEYFKDSKNVSSLQTMQRYLSLAREGYPLVRSNSKKGPLLEKRNRSCSNCIFLQYYPLFLRVFTGKKTNVILRILSYTTKYVAQGDDTDDSMFASWISKFRNAKTAFVDKAADKVGQAGGYDFITGIIKGYISSIPGMIADGLTTIASSAFKGIKTIINLVSEVITWFMNKMAEIFDGVFEIPKDLFDGKKILFCIAIFLFLVAAGHLFDGTIMRAALFAGVVSAVALIGGVVTDQAIGLWEAVYPKDGSYVAQSLGSASFVPLFGFIAACLTSRGLATSLVIMRGMPDVLHNLMDWFRWALDRLYLLISGEHFFFCNETKDALTQYVDDLVELYSDPDLKKKMLIDIPLGNKVKKLANDCPAMRTALSQLKGLSTRYYNHVSTLMTNIVADAERVRCESLAAVQRVTPVVLWLYGDGGQGKGGSMNFLPQAIYEYVSKELPDIYPEPWNPGMKYTKAKGSIYWEQYAQQWCVFNDEFMATTDVRDRGLEGAEFLNVIDQNPLSLNMAFQGKGLNYFTSPFVLISTNIKDKDIEQEGGMTAPNSLMRRRHFHFRVTRNKKVDDILEKRDEAWFFTRYKDENKPDVQKLATEGQESFFYDEVEERFVSCQEVLDRYGLETYDFSGIAELVGKEIVRRHLETDDMRRRMATYEFFPRKQSKKVHFIAKEAPYAAVVGEIPPRPATWQGDFVSWIKEFKRQADSGIKKSLIDDSEYTTERMEREVLLKEEFPVEFKLVKDET